MAKEEADSESVRQRLAFLSRLSDADHGRSCLTTALVLVLSSLILVTVVVVVVDLAPDDLGAAVVGVVVEEVDVAPEPQPVELAPSAWAPVPVPRYGAQLPAR